MTDGLEHRPPHEGPRSRRPRAHISHLIPGRVRLRIPERRRDEAYFATLKQRVHEWPGISAVHVNPRTASLLALFSDAAAALAHAQNCDLFELTEAEPPRPAVPIGERARFRARSFDARLREVTGGLADTQSLVFAALFAAGAYQIIRRRNVGAPAVTLLWYAGDLLRLWNGAPERPGMPGEARGS